MVPVPMAEGTETEAPTRYCGRKFTPKELALLHEIVETCSGLSRKEIAQTVCELLGWRRPSGALKAQECREFLERLESAGALELPQTQPRRPLGSRTRVPVTVRGDRGQELVGEVGDVARIATKDRFARMNGTAPIPASSGQTQRHRLNKGGNRRLNHTLHMMALTQARHDPRARAYLERRRAEGRTRRDALRALKRRLSDVVYQQLRQDAGLARPALT